jgi:hypothetical protein
VQVGVVEGRGQAAAKMWSTPPSESRLGAILEAEPLVAESLLAICASFARYGCRVGDAEVHAAVDVAMMFAHDRLRETKNGKKE